MAVDVGAICEGLAAVVASTGLRCEPAEPDVIDSPMAWVVLGGTGEPFMPEPWEAFTNGLCRMRLTVRVCVGTSVGYQQALKDLWPFLGSGDNTRSILDAIQSDTTFRGALVGGGVKVDEVGSPRADVTFGGVDVVVVDFPITFYASREG